MTTYYIVETHRLDEFVQAVKMNSDDLLKTPSGLKWGK